MAETPLDKATEVRLLCPQCGYDLRGLPENRCPECGQAFDPHDVRRRAGKVGSLLRTLLRLMWPPVLVTITPVLIVLAGVLPVAPANVAAVLSVAGAVAALLYGFYASFQTARRLVQPRLLEQYKVVGVPRGRSGIVVITVVFSCLQLFAALVGFAVCALAINL